MLSNDGIKLFDFHFVRHVLLVLTGGVVVPRACRRYQLNFVSHVVSLVLEGLYHPELPLARCLLRSNRR